MFGLCMLYRHCPEYNMLVAYGGYNGKYHNAVSVYKLPNQAPQASQQAGEQQQASQPAQQPQQQEPKPQQLQQQQDSDQQPGPSSAQVRLVPHFLPACTRLVCWEPGRCCCFKPASSAGHVWCAFAVYCWVQMPQSSLCLAPKNFCALA